VRVAVYNASGEAVHRPPPAEELPERLERLCAFANDDPPGPWVTSIVRAIVVHFTLAYDHPFMDGNGRTARALFYWSMLRGGFWLTEFVSISRLLKAAPAQYSRSFVHCERDDNDLTYFIDDQLDILTRAIRELHEYLQRKTNESRALQVRLAEQGDRFNHRQLAVLKQSLDRPDSVFTAIGHSTAHRVTEETARTDLVGLVREKLMRTFKQGRRQAFAPVTDLASLLDSK